MGNSLKQALDFYQLAAKFNDVLAKISMKGHGWSFRFTTPLSKKASRDPKKFDEFIFLFLNQKKQNTKLILFVDKKKHLFEVKYKEI